MSDPALSSMADEAEPAAGYRRHGKLCDRIYEFILRQIISQAYPEESKLPAEAALALYFGVSRPVVREALARLRADNLVYSRRGSGTFVTRHSEQLVLRFAPVESIADIDRCFEFRIALEGEAAAVAAEWRRSEDIAAMERALHNFDEAVHSNRFDVDADFDFHLAVVKATHSQYFISSLSCLADHMRFGMNLARDLSQHHRLERLAQVRSEHTEIQQAVKKGDIAAARSKMRDHIASARRRVFGVAKEYRRDALGL